MDQEWHDQRDCVRDGGTWRNGRCEHPEHGRRAARAMAARDAMQQAVDVAAEHSRSAWLLSGQFAAYLLAEARPRADGAGHVRFDGLLLLDRARKAREMAAAWIAAAEAWEDAERRANVP